MSSTLEDESIQIHQPMEKVSERVWQTTGNMSYSHAHEVMIALKYKYRGSTVKILPHYKAVIYFKSDAAEAEFILKEISK